MKSHSSFAKPVAAFGWKSYRRMGLVVMVLLISMTAPAQSDDVVVAPSGLFSSLTEPPCSYCSTQNRKGFIRDDDKVVAWIRAHTMEVRFRCGIS